jgi:hypothetical protein
MSEVQKLKQRIAELELLESAVKALYFAGKWERTDRHEEILSDSFYFDLIKNATGWSISQPAKEQGS